MSYEYEFLVAPIEGWGNTQKVIITHRVAAIILALVPAFLMHSIFKAKVDMKTLALRDTLTGLYNRNKLKEDTSDIYEKYSSEREMIVAIIDIDNFKEINDEFGHESGDNVLIELAQRMRKLNLDSFECYRLGGDEFIIFVNNKMKVHSVSEVQHEIVKNLNFELMIEDTIQPIKVSCGVSEMALDGKSISDLMSIADKRMYVSKKSKR
jgi:diguanylate cyclase (GGDEF)-like protein